MCSVQLCVWGKMVFILLFFMSCIFNTRDLSYEHTCCQMQQIDQICLFGSETRPVWKDLYFEDDWSSFSVRVAHFTFTACCLVCDVCKEVSVLQTMGDYGTLLATKAIATSFQCSIAHLFVINFTLATALRLCNHGLTDGDRLVSRLVWGL